MKLLTIYSINISFELDNLIEEREDEEKRIKITACLDRFGHKYLDISGFGLMDAENIEY